MAVTPAAPGIRVRGLTKAFGRITAVTDLTFDVEPGTVTGFVGPNGAGKTTTMRMIVGLVRPTAGDVTVDGRPYRALHRPSDVVGAVLDRAGFHPRHTARRHVSVYARMGGHPDSRVTEVLDLAGATAFADRPSATWSTGMRQRVNLATALLGDPRILLLDEPSNGLDPQGMAWLRALLRDLAARGRAVLVSSHLIGELEQVADRVVVIRAGRLVADIPVHQATPQRSTLEDTVLHLTTDTGETRR